MRESSTKHSPRRANPGANDAATGDLEHPDDEVESFASPPCLRHEIDPEYFGADIRNRTDRRSSTGCRSHNKKAP